MIRINVAAQLCAVAAVSLSLGAIEAQADTILWISDQNDNIGQVDINTQSVVASSVHNTGQAFHDAVVFAVNSIRQWWLNVGRARYPNPTRLLITADGRGSNGSRVRPWKRELQKLANERRLDIVVSRPAPASGTKSSPVSSSSSARTGVPSPSSAIGSLLS